jgi:hypothetical protein
MMQEQRKRAENQVRAMTTGETTEPCGVIKWLAANSRYLENQVKLALDYYSGADPLSIWARSVDGIGPVISSGLRAHIDLTRCTSVGDIWRFGGVDPTSKWEKGEKRPWNASLKTLLWKIGESFVKVSNKPTAFYGAIYQQRKLYEQAKNEKLEYAAQAADLLKRVPGHKQKAIYAAGKLPDGHIHARAKRYAVKLFLSAYFEKGLTLAGRPVPLPYPLANMPGHVHKIEVPEAKKESEPNKESEPVNVSEP